MNTAFGTAQSVEKGPEGTWLVSCRMEDETQADAVAYVVFCPSILPGDRLLLNTTAVDLRLGTGGVHFVVANLSAGPAREAISGHIMKLRYTPLQTPVLSAEAPESAHHAILRDQDRLDGAPVICCELLSQVPSVLAGCRHGGSVPRAVLVMTDEAALPVGFSRLIAELRARRLVDAVVTAGQAFGGDLEAVNVYSGLLAARYAAGAEVILVSPGPGTVGTGTKWGFGGVAQGQAVNAAATLGGQAIAVVRASAREQRDRHLGISHHTRTVFHKVALAPFQAAWPEEWCGDYQHEWVALLGPVAERCKGTCLPGAAEALDALESTGLTWGTMGRSRDEDPLFYETAAAAGLLARKLWTER